jgi:hypothetical protein
VGCMKGGGKTKGLLSHQAPSREVRVLEIK